ncbi:hypothetical protein [Salarchaeum japonicum]|uniref:Uncharacterized protein n=1 Tax=Salarchaeum japonicum TaxID=555573 RepID=A0AAV3T3H5_9EURY|nr:hypothetical protein [Salarchaeum japonicum]
MAAFALFTPLLFLVIAIYSNAGDQIRGSTAVTIIQGFGSLLLAVGELSGVQDRLSELYEYEETRDKIAELELISWRIIGALLIAIGFFLSLFGSTTHSFSLPLPTWASFLISVFLLIGFPLVAGVGRLIWVLMGSVYIYSALFGMATIVVLFSPTLAIIYLIAALSAGLVILLL